MKVKTRPSLKRRVNFELPKNLDFPNLNIDTLIKEYREKDPVKLQEEGFQNALKLFHEAAERVPAYKDFLKKHKIDHKQIKTYEDFQKVPIIDKKNYLRAYPLKKLCWDGKLQDNYVISSSSGSSGQPFLWPRGEEQELEGGLNFEVIFKEFFNADKKKTLYIDCFAMGTWIAGPFVLACAQYIARKGYSVMTLTPGIDKDITFGLFAGLADEFDQIVISGYPPFIKDMIDLGSHYGVDWKKYDIHFLFAAEGFSEKWRDYIRTKVGSKDVLTNSINMYGSADAAILAHETPLTIAIRRTIGDKTKTLVRIFGDTRIPTLAQYDPRLKFFEEVDGKVIFTTSAGIPLVRYSIGDEGGIYQFNEMKDALGKDWVKIKDKVERRHVWNLPYVYLFGRSDLTISFYGLLIYPEHIKYGIEHAGVDSYITGKFVMSSENDENQDPYFLVRVEMQQGLNSCPHDIKKQIQESVVDGLFKLNTEYKKLTESINGRARPVIKFVKYGDADYFKSGAKQKWVQKQVQVL